MLKQLTLTVGVGVAVLSAIDPASAHARLKSAQPAVGATVKTAPSAVILTFGEGVVPKFSGITLADGAGKAVAVGKAASAGGAASLTVPIEAELAPGTYTVTWHAVSVDSHRTQGSFRFTVAP